MRMLSLKRTLFILSILLIVEINAQNPGAFTGSTGGGYALSEISGTELLSTRGSAQDGYASEKLDGNPLIAFTGSSGDGYTRSTHISSLLSAFLDQMEVDMF